ncbi:MAG: hypothetical protein V1799_16910 [bacterium]
MKALRSVIIVMGLFLLLGDAQGQTQNYYAAVFLNRANVSVGSASGNGVFQRRGNDTGWKNIYRNNLFAFGIDFSNPKKKYIAAGNGLHRSTDGGATWRILTSWKTEEVLSVAIDPVDQRCITIATPQGIFQSVDDGETWHAKRTGFRKWFVQQVMTDNRNRRILYAAAEDDLYKTTNRGDLWKPLGVGKPGIMTVFQHPVNGDTLLVGTEDDGVFYSFDGGKRWRQSAGLPSTAFYATTSTPDGLHLYAGGNQTGLWRSDNAGVSWKQVWNAPNIESIFTILIHPQNQSYIMVGTNAQGIFESKDQGKTWIAAGLQGAHVKQIILCDE